MQNNNVANHDTLDMVVNGITLTLVFSDKEKPGVMDEVKGILTASFDKSQVCKN